MGTAGFMVSSTAAPSCWQMVSILPDMFRLSSSAHLISLVDQLKLSIVNCITVGLVVSSDLERITNTVLVVAASLAMY